VYGHPRAAQPLAAPASPLRATIGPSRQRCMEKVARRAESAGVIESHPPNPMRVCSHSRGGLPLPCSLPARSRRSASVLVLLHVPNGYSRRIYIVARFPSRALPPGSHFPYWFGTTWGGAHRFYEGVEATSPRSLLQSRNAGFSLSVSGRSTGHCSHDVVATKPQRWLFTSVPQRPRASRAVNPPFERCPTGRVRQRTKPEVRP